MSSLPADIANQALDAVGSSITLGDIEEGSREAKICLRAYGQCIRQLARAAHWDAFRKQAPLTLLADATGQTANVGTLVIQPWTYEYSYPVDCLKARFVPWNNVAANGGVPGNISLPNTPLSPALGQPPMNNMRIRPARFLVANDYNYPVEQGQGVNDTAGVSPISRTVVLTNVKQAQLVYTAYVPYPSLWDALFRAAMVAYLASEIALPIWSEKDRKFGLTLRAQQIAIAKEKIMQARVSDGNEGFANVDIIPDYIRFRSSGRNRGGVNDFSYDNGPGVFGYGWDACSFGNGDAY